MESSFHGRTVQLIIFSHLFVQLMHTQIALKVFKYYKLLKLQHLLQRVSVYKNHHQEVHCLCFAKVTILISVVHVVNEVFGAVAAHAQPQHQKLH